ERGAHVRVHDPISIANTQKLYPDLPVDYCDTPECLAIGCDALVVVTDWQDYKHLPLTEMRARMRGDFLLDARNLLNPGEVRAHGFTYASIGR
ncbi:MAG: UDP binding domain-containing protein, partial [Deinococcota bacterium]|nr:UDP binding domain-containing protein [Deinococcota bacterium]